MKKGKLLTAILLGGALLVSAISAYPGNASGAEETAISLSNPSIKNGVTTWDLVEFGKYWQEDTNRDGYADEQDAMTSIQWRVLSVSDDEVFLMADQCLDWLSYNDPIDPADEPTWENSLLRYWLNNNFHRDAFSAEEQDAMKIVTVSSDGNAENDTQDKLYVLSYSDISNTAYGFAADAGSADKSRCTQKTGFAQTMTKRAYGDEKDTGWWLRTFDSSKATAKVVERDGSISNQSCTSDKGVRPVVHVKLSASSVLRKVGSVTSNDASIPTTTKKPSATQKPITTQKPVTTKKPVATKKPNVGKKEVIKGKAPKFKVKFILKNKKQNYNRIKITYTLPKNAAGCQIRYKRDKGEWTTLTLKRKKHKLMLSTWIKGTYRIQIRSYTKNRASYSKWSKTKKLKVTKLYPQK